MIHTKKFNINNVEFIVNYDPVADAIDGDFILWDWIKYEELKQICNWVTELKSKLFIYSNQNNTGK